MLCDDDEHDDDVFSLLNGIKFSATKTRIPSSRRRFLVSHHSFASDTSRRRIFDYLDWIWIGSIFDSNDYSTHKKDSKKPISNTQRDKLKMAPLL
jgi:hypothetical protein